ncbi:hypothetical protein J4204_05925 [Candidatus Woesearchaeota archaeon]|nr:hypothetical protein [Candidatus Woesearchaeota archaeon]
MVKEKDEDSGLFFVQIKEPAEVRRNILETLKEIVEVLKRFEKFRHIRHEKLQKIQHLRVLIRQANKTLGVLKAKLPQTNLRATVVREAQPRKIHHKKKKKEKHAEPEKAPKKEMTEAEKLEAELNAIESKLKNLA